MMLRKNILTYCILIALLINILLKFYLFEEYIIYLAAFHNGMTDANEFIQRANEMRNKEYPKFPHYYSRSLVYLIFGVEKFPPLTLQTFTIIATNVLISYLILFLITSELLKLYSEEDKVNFKYLFPVIIIFSPGLFFLDATLRPEIPGILLLYFYLRILRNDAYDFKIFAIAIILSPFMRLSQPFVTFLVICLKNELDFSSKKINPAKNFIIINIVFIIIYTFFKVVDYEYFTGGWYSFIDYGDNLRGMINIKEYSDIYLIFLRTIVAYFLDSLSFRVWIDIFRNPENINNIAASFRVFLIFCITILMYKKLLIKNDFLLISLYFCMTIPVIASIGFFQTRYLIIPDTILYFIVLNKFSLKNIFVLKGLSK